jgi:hypothetical protein
VLNDVLADVMLMYLLRAIVLQRTLFSKPARYRQACFPQAGKRAGEPNPGILQARAAQLDRTPEARVGIITGSGK